jgi:hypothetical protein
MIDLNGKIQQYETPVWRAATIHSDSVLGVVSSWCSTMRHGGERVNVGRREELQGGYADDELALGLKCARKAHQTAEADQHEADGNQTQHGQHTGDRALQRGRAADLDDQRGLVRQATRAVLNDVASTYSWEDL